ncbi:MAG: hypothetical protein KZQ99_14415 [Candidatus Thiodiazotropha sp. (ex Dulcina madagascariensis)]|nr:hypothetical protein [Candidatus Thiodiazotropha sp. (ex Dulcina madagascariensis)]
MTVNDYRKSCIRTVSVMNQLAIKIGANNPNHFSRIFDEVTGEDTQSSGLWRQNFSGKRPLSDKQLDRLLCIETQVNELHTEGPSKLWVAMWGDVSELISILRGYKKNISQMPLHTITKQVFLSIRDSNDGKKTLKDMVWAICLYRLTIDTQPSASVDGFHFTQASCAWALVETCMSDKLVMKELDALGISLRIKKELEAKESERRHKLNSDQWLQDAGAHCYYEDISREEAKLMGAFVEDAISEEDAADSYGIEATAFSF